MRYPLSRALGLATCGYAAYALARPGHLARALEAAPGESRSLDRLARTYGVRDLASSALLLSSDRRLVRAAMGLRVASDLGDCAVLGATTDRPEVRRKVVAVTSGWATLNALAWWLDERG